MSSESRYLPIEREQYWTDFCDKLHNDLIQFLKSFFDFFLRLLAKNTQFIFTSTAISVASVCLLDKKFARKFIVENFFKLSKTRQKTLETHFSLKGTRLKLENKVFSHLLREKRRLLKACDLFLEKWIVSCCSLWKVRLQPTCH